MGNSWLRLSGRRTAAREEGAGLSPGPLWIPIDPLAYSKLIFEAVNWAEPSTSKRAFSEVGNGA
jgi:hypothetical protein